MIAIHQLISEASKVVCHVKFLGLGRLRCSDLLSRATGLGCFGGVVRSQFGSFALVAFVLLSSHTVLQILIFRLALLVVLFARRLVLLA